MVLYAYAQYKDKRWEKFTADQPVNSAKDIAWIRSLLESTVSKPERILISVQ